MLNQYRCQCCGKTVLAFDDDVAANRVETFAEIEAGDRTPHQCHFLSTPPSLANNSILHGETGFSCEGVVLDSMDSIHDHESIQMQKAEEERELKAYMKSVKDF